MFVEADDKLIKNKNKETIGFMCTFENGLCKDWKNARDVVNLNKHRYKRVRDALRTKTIKDWSILSGSTPSMFTGPKIDHTTLSDSGKSLFVNAKEHNQGDIFVVQTPEVTLFLFCLPLYYFLPV